MIKKMFTASVILLLVVFFAVSVFADNKDAATKRENVKRVKDVNLIKSPVQKTEDEVVVYATDFETEGEWTVMQQAEGAVAEWVEDDAHSPTHAWHVPGDVAMDEASAVPTEVMIVSPELILPTEINGQGVAKIYASYWVKAVTPNTAEDGYVYDVWEAYVGTLYPLGSYWHASEENAFGGTGASWWCGNPDKGTYGANWNTTLSTPVLDLSAAGTVTLNFKNAPDAEAGWDSCYVEISGDAGATWTVLAGYSEENDPVVYRDESIDISAHKTAEVVVRWRFQSDGNTESVHGWHIDDVVISDGAMEYFKDDGGDTEPLALIADPAATYDFARLHYDYDDGRNNFEWTLEDKDIIFNGTLDLADYAGETIVFGLNASTDGWNRLGDAADGGFFFDDVEIVAISGQPHDAAVGNVYVGYPTTVGQETPLAVDIANVGFEPETGIGLWYAFDDQAGMPVPPFIALDAGTDTTRIFPRMMDLPPGEHEMKAWATLGNDGDLTNNENWSPVFDVDPPGMAVLGYDDRNNPGFITSSTCFTWFMPMAEIQGTPSYNLHWARVAFYDFDGIGDTVDVTIAEVDPNNPFAYHRVLWEGKEILPPGDFGYHYFEFGEEGVKGLKGDIVVLVDMANSNGSGTILMNRTPWAGHNIYYDPPSDGWYYSSYGRMMNIGISYFDQSDIMSVVDIPNDQGGKVLVSWEASMNEMSPMPVNGYGLWHKVDPDVFDMSAVTPVEVPNMDALYDYGKNAKTNDVVTVRGTEDVASWRFVGMVPAHPGMHDYSLAAATWKDSTVVDGLYLNFYMVTAYGEGGHFVDSEEAGGYSVDNLHPHAPMGLAAMEAEGGVDVSWEAPVDADFDYFALYRADLAEPIAMTTALSFVDANVEAGQNYTYRLVAFDFSGNESDPAEVTLTVTSVDGQMNMIPTEYALKNNYPNPFNPVTTIKYELPDPSHVTIKVLNISGQEVATLVNTDKPAGYHTISWEATNFGSGVYFYTMKAGDFKATQKMILTK